MRTVICGREYAPRILSILNDVIATSTALYDYGPRDMTAMAAWFDAKERGSFPVIGLLDDRDEVTPEFMGFATYGPFRAWPAYKYTVEHSVYVDRAFRRRGAGRILLQRIIRASQEQGYHNLIAGIDADNEGSLALHREFGFVCCGTIQHAGFKFGRWLNLQFHQLILEGPEHPVDG